MGDGLESWNPNARILEEIVLDLTRRNPDLHKKGLFVKGISYSAQEILEGLNSGNILGRTFYELYLRMRDC